MQVINYFFFGVCVCVMIPSQPSSLLAWSPIHTYIQTLLSLPHKLTELLNALHKILRSFVTATLPFF